MEYRRLVCINAAVLIAASSIALGSGSPTNAELLAEIDKLRARIEQLEAAQHQVSTADVDEVVERVMRDADRRSQFLADNAGLTAGFERGKFFLRSDDGNYLLVPGFVFQARYTANSRGDAKSSGDDDAELGFEIRRMTLIFEGHAVAPELQYKFQWETRSNGGDIFLQDAWVRYKLTPQWRVQAGQFKDGVHHEEAMLDQYSLAAERSFINALIGGGTIDRVQGVMLIYDDAEHLRLSLAAHDGYNTKNTDYTESGGGTTFIGVNDLNFGFSARVEYIVMGPPKQYDDFSAMNNKQDLLVFGAGVNWSQGGDSDVLFHTLDAQWENTAGLGVYGALLGLCRDIGADSTVAEGRYYDWGGLIQAGYLITEKVELFGRYEYIDLDQGALTASAEDTLHELTIGTNYFYSGHNAKLTLDLSWLPNGSPTTLSGLGILSGDESQWIARLQAQLVL